MDAFLDQSGLSVGALNVLKGMGGEWSVERILTLTYDQLMVRPACGKKKAGEIIAFQQKCRAGEVWNDEVHEVAEEVPRPEQFPSLAEYVLAVAAKTCELNARTETILRYGFGLLNVGSSETKTLDEMGQMFGGVTRQCVNQKSKKLKQKLFSERGKALFAEFVKCAEVIFAQNNFVLRERAFVAGLNEVYPNWSGTTEFSALPLLEHCGISIESFAGSIQARGGGGERGYWGRRPHRGRPTIVRVFEMSEPCVELHEGKFPVACELTVKQFAAMMERRVESWGREPG